MAEIDSPYSSFIEKKQSKKKIDGRARAKSDEFLPVTSLGKPVLRKYNTISKINHKSHKDWKLSSEALLKLQERHEQYCRNRRSHSVIDTTVLALKEAFGKHGSWLLYGKLPDNAFTDAEFERQFSRRPIQYWGKTKIKDGVIKGAEGEYFLKNFGIAMVNTKGLKSFADGRVNNKIIGQDNCSIAKLTDGSEVFCVMDGHGQNAHWVSTRAVQTMPFFLQESCMQFIKARGFEAALTSAFRKVEEDLENKAETENINLLVCGTTATVAIRDKERNDLWVATVGDSRAVLLVPGEGAVYSTKDHKPSDRLEAQRLERHGAYVDRIEYDDGDVEERIFIKGEDYPGLAMTRSLGDVCVKQHGVIADPVVEKWSLRKWPRSYYLACSDGVWEFLPTAEVADFVLTQLEEGRRCTEICELLLDKAKQKWAEYDPTYVDDITLLLVPLDDTTRPTRGLQTHLRAAEDCLVGCKRECNLM